MVVLRSNPFSTSQNDDGSDLKLVNLITKQAMPTQIANDVLNIETHGRKALDRIIGDMNM